MWKYFFSLLETFFYEHFDSYDKWKMKGKKIDIKKLIYFHSFSAVFILEWVNYCGWMNFRLIKVLYRLRPWTQSTTLSTQKGMFDAFSRRQIWFSRISFWHWWKIKSKAIKFNIGWWRKLFRKHENASREVNFSLRFSLNYFKLIQRIMTRGDCFLIKFTLGIHCGKILI